MSIKSVKMKISGEKYVPKITQPKSQVPRSIGVPCRPRTDGRTDRHGSENSGHPFRVSGFFPFNLSSRSIVWENTTPSTELPRDFCAGTGPLQLGVVLVFYLTEDQNYGRKTCQNSIIRSIM